MTSTDVQVEDVSPLEKQHRYHSKQPIDRHNSEITDETESVFMNAGIDSTWYVFFFLFLYIATMIIRKSLNAPRRSKARKRQLACHDENEGTFEMRRISPQAIREPT